jgi:signal peptidase I
MTPVQTLDKSPGRPKSVAREYAESIIIAIVLAVVIRTFVVQAFKIPSGSMEDTLLIGDHILVNKLSYGIQLPFWAPNPCLRPVGDPERATSSCFPFLAIPRVTSSNGSGLPGPHRGAAECVYINGEP